MYKKNVPKICIALSIYYISRYKIVLCKFFIAASKIHAMQIRAMRNRASRGMTVIGLFTLPGALFKSGIAMKLMQYMFVLMLFVTRLKVPFLESIMVAVIRIAGIHTTHVILNTLIIMIVLVTIS